MSTNVCQQLKRVRTQVKRRQSSLQKDVDTAKKLLVASESDVLSSTQLIEQLDEHITVVSDSLKILDEYPSELSEYGEEEADDILEQEIEQLTDFSIDVNRWISKMTAYRNRLQNRTHISQSSTFNDVNDRQLNHSFNHTSGVPNNSYHSGNGTVPTVKLPKLEMRKFDGDLLKFKEFWDTFEVAIDQNTKLQPIEKLNYLLCQLEGDAKAAISGLPLSNDSYSVAVELIKERFGNPQTLVASLYSRLMNLPLTPNNTVKLRNLYDELECITRSLVSLNQSVDNQQFVSVILSKLPHEVVLILERSKGLGVDWSTGLIRRVLHSELSAREAAERTRGATSPISANYSSTSRPQRKTGEALNAVETRPPKTEPRQTPNKKRCIYCEIVGHWSDECRKFPTARSRREKIKGRCYNCFMKSHSSKTCTVQKSCPYCSKTGHHRSLCNVKFGTSKNENAHIATESDPLVSEGTSETSNVEESLLSIGSQVLLQTAIAGVRKIGMSGYADSRLLLDSACHRSYITQALARKLNLELNEGEVISVNTFGSTKHKDISTKTANIELKTKEGKPFQISVNVDPNITGDVSRTPLKFGNIAKLWENLQLADSLPTVKEISTIDILIGNDFYLDIISGEKMKVKDGLYLLGSCFGWILSGRYDTLGEKSNDLSMIVISHTNTVQVHEHNPLIFRVDDQLPLKVNFEDYWNLENIGITDPPDITDDDRAVQCFENTIKFEEGRYQVCFPWKDEIPELVTNYNLSYYRLKSVVENRLSGNEDLLRKYNNIIEDQLKKGVIEKIDEGIRDGPLIHYLPHHPVITEQKATTKVRIVYDGSAKSKKGAKSLNECLLRGPVILSDLCGLLIRFRQKPIAIIADIEKAFLQVGLQKQDREVTRFIWLNDPTIPKVDGNIQIYRFCRVPFGAISSPFLLAATCVHHLRADGSNCALQICDNMYVDNVITGIDCLNNAQQFYIDAKCIFQNAGMNLREWASNSCELINSIPDVDKAKIDNLKVLGMVWKPLTDTISIGPSETLQANSKRNVLKAVASIFDPLGYFAPVTVLGKMFLQELWCQKLDWDDPLPEDKQLKWATIAENLEKIPNILFPRFLSIYKEGEFQLVCFCDASKRCYATAVYLLNVTKGKPTSSNLVFAKVRLAPKKIITLPRLELLAVVIGIRSMRFVKEQCRLPISQLILFTDSQCVLHWICSNKNLERFVANRLKEIKGSTDVTFRYVNTTNNPADLPTRGKLVKDLDAFWFQGPSWLPLNQQKWPQHDVPIISQETLQELSNTDNRNSAVLFETGLSAGESPMDLHPPFSLDLERYSSILKVYRITAWCLRFVTRGMIFTDTLTAEELAKAKLMWERYIQKQNFPVHIKDLEKGVRTPAIKQLSLYLDSDGLIRCYGRLGDSNLNLDAIYPKLLPKKHRFAELNILKCHSSQAHSGVAQTLAVLRNQYWIPHGRTVVKGVLKTCRLCRRWEGGSFKYPSMPDLPKERVFKANPFSQVGIDYFGPLYVKRNEGCDKCWVCLYTCMVSRAIHLELMRDMTTEQFMLGFRRFTARRGKPTLIISDNAKQFRLSKTVIAEVWGDILRNPVVQDYSTNSQITWRFIVQLAPWMGGFYERLVGLVKRALKKSLGPLHLSYDHLNTLLFEIETIVNTRPLTYVGEELDEIGVLTPAKLLYFGSLSGSLPSINITKEDEDPCYVQHPNLKHDVIESWKKGLRHLDAFWEIWKNEYLLSLRERGRHHYNRPGTVEIIPKVGQVVLLKENLIPRGRWRLARILINLTNNRDNKIRSATVIVSSGNKFSRPVTHLYPLEIDDTDLPEILPDIQKVNPTEAISRVKNVRKASRLASEKITSILQKETEDFENE